MRAPPPPRVAKPPPAAQGLLPSRLSGRQQGVDPGGINQFIVRALLHHASLRHDADLVGAADGGEAVGDDEGGAAFAQMAESLLHGSFGLRVERRGRLVQQEDGRVLEEGARYGDALALAA